MINIDYLLQLHLIGKNNKGITPSPPIEVGKVYGVVIDSSNGNSEESVTYTDDAIGFVSAKGNDGNFDYGSWENRFPFNQIKPCVIKDGIVRYYLNPNDYSKKLDGSVADINSAINGDVMIEFPTVYWKFEKLGDKLYVKYSDVQIDYSYQALAHQKGTKILDKIYIGAYLTSANISDNKLASISNSTPLVNVSLNKFRERTINKFNEYEVLGYYQVLMLQVLYLIMFKNLDSQTALGRGIVNSGTSANTKSGILNDKGLFYGKKDSINSNKFCGIENIYGHYGIFVDGIFVDQYKNVKIAVDSFNSSNSGYVTQGVVPTVPILGNVKKVIGTTNLGFIPTEVGGIIHYADEASVQFNSYATFGLRGTYLRDSGMFNLRIDAEPFNYPDIGSRMMYRI